MDIQKGKLNVPDSGEYKVIYPETSSDQVVDIESNKKVSEVLVDFSEQLTQIVVGGVNLLDDSQLDTKPTWLSGLNGTFSIVNSVGKLEVTTEGATAVRLQLVLAANTLSANDAYTLSFKYKSNTKLEIKGLVNATITNASDLPISNDWRVGYFTFKATDVTLATTLRIYTTNLTIGTYVEVDYFKLERGDRYSDYTTSVNDQYKLVNNRLTTASSVTRYGALKFPSEFTKPLPFKLYRDRDNKIKHDINKVVFASENKIYINQRTGNDTKNGLSVDNAVKTLTKAIELSGGIATENVDIVILDYIIRADSLSSTPSTQPNIITLNKNIRILSDNEGGSFIGSWYPSYTFTWNNVGGGVYSTTRSNVLNVFDYDFRDFNGLPKQLNKVETLEGLDKGTYFVSGNVIYIKRENNEAPGSSIAMLLPIDSSTIFDLNGYRLVIDNVHWWNAQNTINYNALTLNGNQTSSAFIFNSSFRFSRFNGLAHTSVGEIYLFNCVASDNGYDGFNYHGDGDEFGFEYDCYSYNNGAIIRGTGNATTAHDGITMLRIGTVGHDCYGPLLADVNGCLSINYDCIMYDSLRAAGATKSAYWVDNAAAAAGKIGKLYLYNCQGGGTNTYTVNGDGIAQIYASGLIGGNILQNTVVNNI